MEVIRNVIIYLLVATFFIHYCRANESDVDVFRGKKLVLGGDGEILNSPKFEIFGSGDRQWVYYMVNNDEGTEIHRFNADDGIVDVVTFEFEGSVETNVDRFCGLVGTMKEGKYDIFLSVELHLHPGKCYLYYGNTDEMDFSCVLEAPYTVLFSNNAQYDNLRYLLVQSENNNDNIHLANILIEDKLVKLNVDDRILALKESWVKFQATLLGAEENNLAFHDRNRHVDDSKPMFLLSPIDSKRYKLFQKSKISKPWEMKEVSLSTMPSKEMSLQDFFLFVSPSGSVFSSDGKELYLVHETSAPNLADKGRIVRSMDGSVPYFYFISQESEKWKLYECSPKECKVVSLQGEPVDLFTNSRCSYCLYVQCKDSIEMYISGGKSVVITPEKSNVLYTEGKTILFDNQMGLYAFNLDQSFLAPVMVQDNLKIPFLTRTWDKNFVAPFNDHNTFSIYELDLNFADGCIPACIHGTCDTSTSTCRCEDSFTGRDCKNCGDLPCYNGLCRQSKCICLSEKAHGFWGGAMCDVCMNSRFDIGSKCKQCKPGYFGRSCDEFKCYNKDYKDPKVCNGHGKCIQANQCQCEKDWAFSYDCRLTQCFSKLSNDVDVCSGRGNCTSFDSCVCEEAFSGKQCENQKRMSLLTFLGILFLLGLSLFMIGSCLAFALMVYRNHQRSNNQFQLLGQDDDELQSTISFDNFESDPESISSSGDSVRTEDFEA